MPRFDSGMFVACALCSFVSMFLEGGEVVGVQIKDLKVPEVVQNGTEPAVVLDCDYSLEEGPHQGLVVKWFLNNNPAPVYQWIPDQKPQDLGVLKGKLNLEYKASENNATMHRALQILNPTTELSGEYRCMVSTFLNGEDSKSKKMVIFVPVKSLQMTLVKQKDNTAVNVSCTAEGVFPEPKLSIHSESRPNLTQPDVIVNVKNSGLFDITATLYVEDEFLETPTTFECELKIPEANYTVKQSSIYYPGPPTTKKESPSTGIDDSKDDSSTKSSATTWLLCFVTCVIFRL